MRQHLADPSRLRGQLPLVGVLALALALRLWGITWGLPSATHYFSYHPDESLVLGVASGMSVFGGQLLPHWYHYGSLQIYLVCFANTLAALFGYVDIVPKNLAAWHGEWAKMYFIGRLLTVGMGVGTVWIVYALGLRLWGRRAGFYAALTLALMPLHVQHSHFLTVDVPGTFWELLSLLWAVRLATDDPKPGRAALVAGLCAGLAAATKYNLALAILPVLAACAMRPQEPTPARSSPPLPKGKELQKMSTRAASLPSPLGRADAKQSGGFLLVALVVFALAFLAACPGAVLENKTFLDNVRFEAVHVQNPDDPTFRDTGNGFVYHITHNLEAGLGWPLLVFALVSVGWALSRWDRGDGLLAAFALPYYILISLAAVRYARYTIPLLPILALWVGRMLADLSRLPQATWRKASLVVAAVCFAGTLLTTSALTSRMTNQDTRDEALTWLNNYAPKSARVGFAVQPWFGTVPVSPYFTSPRPGSWRAATPPETLAQIVYSGKDWDIDALKAQRPDVVVLSEYDYNDALRLHNPEATAYIAELRREYTAFVAFPPLYSHIPSHLAPMPSSDLPHDMTYPSPDIVICTRGNRSLF